MGATASAGDLTEMFALLTDERMPDCLHELFASEFDEGDGSFEVTDLDVGSGAVDGLGDENARFLISYDIAQDGEAPVPASAEMVVARDGRVVAMVMLSGFGDVGSDVSAPDLAALLLDTAVAQLG
jgi:hypothetical protein